VHKEWGTRLTRLGCLTEISRSVTEGLSKWHIKSDCPQPSRYILSQMKIQSLIVLFLVCCPLALSARGPKPFEVVDLTNVKGDASGCDVKWTNLVNRVVWIDDGHLVAWLLTSCYSHEPKDRKSQEKLVFIDTNEHVRSIRRDDAFAVLRGPAGTVLVGHGNVVDLMDPEIRTLQTITCPTEKVTCGLFIPLSSMAGSDFAVCSLTASFENCDFYRGQPAAQVPELASSFPITNGIAHTPYKDRSLPDTSHASPYNRAAWKVSQSETWYFDNGGVLTSLSVNGATGPVSKEQWTPKESICTGDPSVSEPRRFLATCVGTHFYTDGDFDAFFGYSRIALFDVASRRILVRIDGAAYSSAVLSPSGKLIAVTHGNKVRLFRVD
jgi:hypothetical protein